MVEDRVSRLLQSWVLLQQSVRAIMFIAVLFDKGGELIFSGYIRNGNICNRVADSNTYRLKIYSPIATDA